MLNAMYAVADLEGGATPFFSDPSLQCILF